MSAPKNIPAKRKRSEHYIGLSTEAKADIRLSENYQRANSAKSVNSGSFAKGQLLNRNATFQRRPTLNYDAKQENRRTNSMTNYAGMIAEEVRLDALATRYPNDKAIAGKLRKIRTTLATVQGLTIANLSLKG